MQTQSNCHLHLRLWLLLLAMIFTNAATGAPTAPGYVWTVASTTGDDPLAVAVDNQGHIRTAGQMSGVLFFHSYDTEGQVLSSAYCTNFATFSSAAIDSAGNTYATGGFGSSGQFGSIKLTGSVNGSMFVAKYSPDGKALWAIGSTGGAGVYGWAVAIDPAGNSYVTGEFMGSPALQVRIGTIPLNNYVVGNIDAFIAKVDPNGKLLWAMPFGDGGVIRCMAVAVDASGNAYAGANSVIAGGAVQLVYKFSTDGKLLWKRSSKPANAPRIASAAAGAIAVDAQGNVSVTGGMSGTNIFGQTTLWTIGGDLDLEITRYDSAGNTLWACKDGGTNIDGAIAAVMDGSGNAYIEGLVDTWTTIGGTAITNGDYYIAKCNADGSFAWALPGPHYPNQLDSVRGIMAAAADGSVYVSGFNFPSSLSKIGLVDAPTITSQPTNHLIKSGYRATLTVQAAPARAVSYQWYQGVSGDVSHPVSLGTNVYVTADLWQTTSFWVRASNPAGYADSDTVTVTIATAPKITSLQAPYSVARGQSATLSATATGTEPLSYQWYLIVGVEYLLIPGADSATYTTDPVTNATTYSVIVTNLAGVDATNAMIRPTDPPTITKQPQSLTITNGQVVTLSVTVVGGQELLFFQWYQGEAGDTNNPVIGMFNTYTTPPLTATARYWVLVRNSVGRAQSETAVLTLPDANARLGTLGLSGTKLNLQLKGPPASKWRVESTADLGNWQLAQTIGTFILDSAGTTNVQVDLGTRRTVFYRATAWQ